MRHCGLCVSNSSSTSPRQLSPVCSRASTTKILLWMLLYTAMRPFRERRHCHCHQIGREPPKEAENWQLRQVQKRAPSKGSVGSTEACSISFGSIVRSLANQNSTIIIQRIHSYSVQQQHVATTNAQRSNSSTRIGFNAKWCKQSTIERMVR